MEMEQFVEQDISAFLDKRVQEHRPMVPETKSPHREGVLTPEELNVYAPGRDYLSELEELLKKRDYDRGQQLILGYKEHINEYPEESPERLEGNRLLESLYKKYQEALHNNPSAQEALLNQSLGSLAPPEPASEEVPEASGTKVSPTEPAVNPVLDAPSPISPTESHTEQKMPLGLTEDEERALSADIDEIEHLMKQEKFTEAIQAYRETKDRLDPDQLTPAQRERYLERLKKLYGGLHTHLSQVPKTKEAVVEVHVHTKTKEDREKERHQKAVARRFRHHLSAARSASDAGDVAEAMLQYHTLHALFKELPEEGEEVAYKVLAELHTKISAQQVGKNTTLEHEERRLSGKP